MRTGARAHTMPPSVKPQRIPLQRTRGRGECAPPCDGGVAIADPRGQVVAELTGGDEHVVDGRNCPQHDCANLPPSAALRSSRVRRMLRDLIRPTLSAGRMSAKE